MAEVLQERPWESFRNPEVNLPWERFKTPTQDKPWERFSSGSSPQDVAPVTRPQEITLDSVLSKYEGRGLTRKDFMADPELMQLVEKNLNKRYKDGTLVDPKADTRTAEEKFDTWLNYHRAVNAGNSVSLVNEVAYAASADEDTLSSLGEGYKLFDSMDNALIGEGTWADTADAVGDYLYYSVVDPTTILSLGVGKAFAQAGTKGAATALRIGAKAAFDTALKKAGKKGITGVAAKELADKAAAEVTQKGFAAIGTTKVRTEATEKAFEALRKDAVEAGMTEAAARALAKKAIDKTAAQGSLALAKQEATKFAIGSYGTDMVVSVGADLAYQHTQMITGAQEDYSIPQTAIAAIGAIATPAVAAGFRGAAKGVKAVLPNVTPEFNSAVNAFRGRSKEASMELIKSSVDIDALNSNLKGSVKSFLDNLDKSTDWKASIVDAKKAGKLESAQANSEFLRYLLNGYAHEAEGASEGYSYQLAKAGVRYVPRYEGDNPTNFLMDAVSWMDPKVFKTFAEGFEKKAGVKLDIPNYSPAAFAEKSRAAVSGGAVNLNTLSISSKILNTGDGYRAVRKENPISDPESAAYGQWVLSIWKRMLTSHPATTAANVTGWAGLSLLNTTSDLVQGTLEYGVGTFARIGGRADAGRALQQEGKNTLLSVARRGGAILNWEATQKEAQELFTQVPSIREELAKTLAGDSGIESTGSVIKNFNIPDNLATRSAESYVDSAQKLTGVVLQDQITKSLSFMSALDREILRHYGKTYDEFMDQPDAWAQWASKEFNTEVLPRALDRAQRETASKSWTDKKGNNTWLLGAKIMENISNHPYGGYLIPFGRFFNTSVAVIGDFSMVNAIRHKFLKNSAIDKAQDKEMELISRGITGWGIVAGMGFLAQEKIEAGLAWNQELNADGTITDKTFDFPESYLRIAAQVVAHGVKDGEVPRPLYEELIQVYGANAFRASQEGLQAVQDLIAKGASGDAEGVIDGGWRAALNFAANIISGATRPLDVPNQMVGVATGNLGSIDRRQGDVFKNEALRYLDKIFPLEGEQRYSPTRGTEIHTDMGKTLFGSRRNPENTTIDKLLNNIGQAPWQAIRWEGEPEVKNRLDGLIAPVLNAYANKLKEDYPNFNSLKLEQRQHLVTEEVIKPSKEIATRMLRSGSGSESILGVLETLGKKPKGEVSKVLEYLGQGGSVAEIAKMEGGEEKLKTILYLVENWDRIMVP